MNTLCGVIALVILSEMLLWNNLNAVEVVDLTDVLIESDLNVSLEDRNSGDGNLIFSKCALDKNFVKNIDVYFDHFEMSTDGLVSLAVNTEVSVIKRKEFRISSAALINYVGFRMFHFYEANADDPARELVTKKLISLLTLLCERTVTENDPQSKSAVLLALYGCLCHAVAMKGPAAIQDALRTDLTKLQPLNFSLESSSDLRLLLSVYSLFYWSPPQK